MPYPEAPTAQSELDEVREEGDNTETKEEDRNTDNHDATVKEAEETLNPKDDDNKPA